MKGNPLSQRLVTETSARLGAVTRRPLVWILVTAVMAAAGGSRGRRAALRGYLCYLLGGAAGNLPKPLFGRAQPRHLRVRKPQVVRGAFPSGHAAAEVAYVFGASLEAPIAFLPLGTMAMLAHLSLVRAGKHYISDTLVGGMIGLAVVALTARAWPPHTDLGLRHDLGSAPQRSCCKQPEGAHKNLRSSRGFRVLRSRLARSRAYRRRGRAGLACRSSGYRPRSCDVRRVTSSGGWPPRPLAGRSCATSSCRRWNR